MQEEAVRENLKNVVLFMASSGYLVSPRQDPSKELLWTETWKRIDRFMPDLRSDLDQDEPKQEPSEHPNVAIRSGSDEKEAGEEKEDPNQPETVITDEKVEQDDGKKEGDNEGEEGEEENEEDDDDDDEEDDQEILEEKGSEKRE